MHFLGPENLEKFKATDRKIADVSINFSQPPSPPPPTFKIQDKHKTTILKSSEKLTELFGHEFEIAEILVLRKSISSGR